MAIMPVPTTILWGMCDVKLQILFAAYEGVPIGNWPGSLDIYHGRIYRFDAFVNMINHRIIMLTSQNLNH